MHRVKLFLVGDKYGLMIDFFMSMMLLSSFSSSKLMIACSAPWLSRLTEHAPRLGSHG